MFIGGLEENLITDKNLIASQAYYHDTLVWCVQKSKRNPMWLNLFHLISSPIIFINCTFQSPLVIAFVYYLEQFERRHRKWDWNRIFIEALAITMGFPCRYNPKCTPARVFLTFGLFAGILFVIVISSAMMTLITTPIMKHQINSVPEIVEGGFDLIGDRFTLDKLSQENEVKCLGILNTARGAFFNGSLISFT